MLDGGGSGGLVKKGDGKVTLVGTNTFTGIVTVEKGVLRAAHASALGTTNGATIVNYGAVLELGDDVLIGMNDSST